MKWSQVTQLILHDDNCGTLNDHFFPWTVVLMGLFLCCWMKTKCFVFVVLFKAYYLLMIKLMKLQKTMRTISRTFKTLSSDCSSLVLRLITGFPLLLIGHRSFSLVCIRCCLPSAPLAEPVICCHLQTSLSSAFLACSLLIPFSFSFSLPCILNQQPAAPSRFHKKKDLLWTIDGSTQTVMVCRFADVCVFVCKMADCVCLCLRQETG